MEKKYLNYEDFKNFVKTMSSSQGSYCRLYQNLMELEENDIESLEKLKEEIERRN